MYCWVSEPAPWATPPGTWSRKGHKLVCEFWCYGVMTYHFGNLLTSRTLSMYYRLRPGSRYRSCFLRCCSITKFIILRIPWSLRPDLFLSLASTCGSTPTTCSTRMSGQTMLRPFTRLLTGMTWPRGWQMLRCDESELSRFIESFLYHCSFDIFASVPVNKILKPEPVSIFV